MCEFDSMYLQRLACALNAPYFIFARSSVQPMDISTDSEVVINARIMAHDAGVGETFLVSNVVSVVPRTSIQSRL